MGIPEILYKLILGPLELLFDVVYSISYQMINHPGLSIVSLSLVVNLLILPLYLRADRIQEEDRDQAARMKPGVDKIRRVFRGDEQYMILQTYYRQNHYKPYYALKSLLPLLLQIPFFMAAYEFLSDLQLLQGASFGPIRDLGAPDALLKIASIKINVLPVAMTVINLLSGAVYSKGMPLKSKVQMLAIALVFLVLLYNSPSGLVFYWTLNNVFSLLKNLFMRLKNHKTILKGCCSAAGAVLLIFILFIRPVSVIQRKILLIAAAILLQLPALTTVLRKKGVFPASFRGLPYTKTSRRIFWFSCLFLAVLTGCMIPSEVLKSSPGEFVDILNYQNPLQYVLHAFLLAAGTFLLWSPVYYGLSSEKTKGTLSLVFAVFALLSAVNYYGFGTNYGNMSSLMIYDQVFSVRSGQALISILAAAAVAAIVFVILKKAPGLLLAICITGSIAVGITSVANTVQIQSEIGEIRAISENTNDEVPYFTLSRNGKNTVIIMMDRAVGGFVPFIMNEKPELIEKFDGFTWYPNTVSFGCHTNIGAPALYGGYEYIPDMMNARPDESLKDKHNEALKVMPVMFSQEGFDVTVFDPLYANYKWSSDISIYNGYPDIHAYAALGKFGDNRQYMSDAVDAARKRNMFCYSIFRIVPPAVQQVLYDDGYYNTSVRSTAIINSAFVDSYALMSNLSHITRIEDNCKNGSFVTMISNVTHDVELLQEPDYILKASADNRDYEAAHGVRTTADGRTMDIGSSDLYTQKHYQSNAAAYLLLADWLDYLRDNGVYDNTKIILVSDHAFYLGLYGFDLADKYSALPEGSEQYSEIGWTQTMAYNPLLMVKDFNATGFTTDYTFMTNADTPSIAAEGVIPDPVNPFTKQPITADAKNAEEIHLIETEWQTDKTPGNVFLNPMHITLRNQDIFNIDNWTIEDAILQEEED